MNDAEARGRKIRLSICIATYNRAAFIGETLDSILPQLVEGVELLVVDGASTDSTGAVVMRRIEGHQGARYLRLAQKGGVDKDYCLAVEGAAGEFVWLFTDDDLLVPGAVARVLASLEAEVELLVLNAEVRDVTMTRQLVGRRDPSTADRVYTPHEMDRLFRDQAGYLTYIGSVVVRRSTWVSRPADAFLGSEFVHVGVIFSAALPGAAVAIADPLISIRAGNAQWSSRAFEIWNEKWPRLVGSLAGVSPSVRARVAPPEPWRKVRTLIHARALGAFGKEQLQALTRTHAVGFVWTSAAKLIATAPRALVHPAVSWYWRNVRRSTPLELDELAAADPLLVRRRGG